MTEKPERHQVAADRTVRDIRHKTRKRDATGNKFRIMLSGLRGEDSITELCQQEGISQDIYYVWSKEFLKAKTKRLDGDAAREANTGEVKERRSKVRGPKEWARRVSAPLLGLKSNHYVELAFSFWFIRQEWIEGDR